MLYRILGKFFLYFVIIPKVVEFHKQIVRPAITAGVISAIKKDAEKNKEEKARNRADHPAGSKLNE